MARVVQSRVGMESKAGIQLSPEDRARLAADAVEGGGLAAGVCYKAPDWDFISVRGQENGPLDHVGRTNPSGNEQRHF